MTSLGDFWALFRLDRFIPGIMNAGVTGLSSTFCPSLIWTLSFSSYAVIELPRHRYSRTWVFQCDHRPMGSSGHSFPRCKPVLGDESTNLCTSN